MDKKQYIIKYLIFIGVAVYLIGCISDDPVQPTEPVFRGTTKIELTQPDSDIDVSANESFIFNEPEGVDVIILAVFNAEPNINDSTDQIENTANWLYGSSTDFGEISGGSISIQNLRDFVPATGLFDDTGVVGPGISTGADFHWFVFAYKNGFVTHSSPDYTIDINP